MGLNASYLLKSSLLYASIGHYYFFTISCHRPTNQNNAGCQQKLGIFLASKASKFSKDFINKSWSSCLFKEKEIRKIPLIFNTEK